MYERSSWADSSCAFDCATAAAACSNCPCASSRSFCDSAFCCGERFGAREIGLRDFHRRLVSLQRSRRGVDLRLERLRVHPEEDLTGLDDRALGVDALVEEARNARRDVHGLRALRLRDEHGADRYIAWNDGERGHLDWRPRRVLLFLLAAARDQQYRATQRKKLQHSARRARLCDPELHGRAFRGLWLPGVSQRRMAALYSEASMVVDATAANRGTRE